MSVAQLVVNIFVALGGVGALTAFLKSRGERRKLNADAAGVISEKSLAWADRFDKTAERAEQRAESLQRQLDHMEFRVQQLTARIEACGGGSPCPLLPIVDLLGVVSTEQDPPPAAS